MWNVLRAVRGVMAHDMTANVRAWRSEQNEVGGQTLKMKQL